ncbi:hypothetical protein K0504_04385 [Neiella marina]|uniref:Secreted protein n=1 Tax=Neiella holothuriorum TaxID=2870530 RepID=A0ABS7EF03_9GAMM|nr:hypothetical protein [Neiella holothuriorum]MBW8190267.1 hypothetical protein [Neiella holothuriorum]
MKTLRVLVLSLFTTLVAIPSAYADHIDPAKLVGVWGNSSDGGKTFWGYDQYFSDGSTRSWGTVPDTTINYEVEAFYQVKQKFDITNCLTIVGTTHPEVMPVGSSWCDEILEVNDSYLTYKSTDGSVVTLYRQTELAAR